MIRPAGQIAASMTVVVCFVPRSTFGVELISISRFFLVLFIKENTSFCV